eukprot:4266947-Pleurochrysis_carterae.AAC.2
MDVLLCKMTIAILQNDSYRRGPTICILWEDLVSDIRRQTDHAAGVPLRDYPRFSRRADGVVDDAPTESSPEHRGRRRNTAVSTADNPQSSVGCFIRSCIEYVAGER